MMPRCTLCHRRATAFIAGLPVCGESHAAAHLATGAQIRYLRALARRCAANGWAHGLDILSVDGLSKQAATRAIGRLEDMLRTGRK